LQVINTIKKRKGKHLRVPRALKPIMPARILITVEKVKGYCPIYKAGDKIIIEEFYIKSKNSQNICLHAFAAMSTLLSAFLHNCSAAELGIGSHENIGYIACPDSGPPHTKGGNVLFKLEKQK